MHRRSRDRINTCRTTAAALICPIYFKLTEQCPGLCSLHYQKVSSVILSSSLIQINPSLNCPKVLLTALAQPPVLLFPPQVSQILPEVVSDGEYLLSILRLSAAVFCRSSTLYNILHRSESSSTPVTVS